MVTTKSLARMSFMSNIPSKLKYTKDHEWVEETGDIATVGITDFAQSSLGDLVYVELPKIGRQVKKGEVFVIVESCKAASDVYAPLSGEVVEVNEAVVASPDVVNHSPYGAGWLVKIRANNHSEVADLLPADSYKELAA